MDHASGSGHGTHDHSGYTARDGTSWRMGVQATLHCLTGCAIGEILGTALLWGNVPTMILAIALAFVFGYSFTPFAVRRTGIFSV